MKSSIPRPHIHYTLITTEPFAQVFCQISIFSISVYSSTVPSTSFMPTSHWVSFWAEGHVRFHVLWLLHQRLETIMFGICYCNVPHQVLPVDYTGLYLSLNTINCKWDSGVLWIFEHLFYRQWNISITLMLINKGRQTKGELGRERDYKAFQGCVEELILSQTSWSQNKLLSNLWKFLGTFCAITAVFT